MPESAISVDVPDADHPDEENHNDDEHYGGCDSAGHIHEVRLPLTAFSVEVAVTFAAGLNRILRYFTFATVLTVVLAHICGSRQDVRIMIACL